MNFTEQEVGGSKSVPAKITIFGQPKTGKTRFSAEAPDAFLINVEDGAQYLPNKVRSTPHLKSFGDVMAWLNHILKDDKFVCGTLVIDSLDWCETLAQKQLVDQFGADSIVDPKVPQFAYYRGVIRAAEETMRILTALDMIYAKKGIKAIVIAHSDVKEISLPGRDPFHRNQIKTSKYLAAKVLEWSDLVLYFDHHFHVTKDGNVTTPKPVMYAGDNSIYQGGGRMKLPKQLPIAYKALEEAIINQTGE